MKGAGSNRRNVNLLNPEVNQAHRESDKGFQRVGPGKLVKVDLVLRHAMRLCLCSNEHPQDLQRLPLNGPIQMETLRPTQDLTCFPRYRTSWFPRERMKCFF